MSLDQAHDIVKHQTATRDAFLGGRLGILQPRRGFRGGLDSVLLGAAVAPRAGSLLDLGAGVGIASLVAMAGSPRVAATLVDADPGLLALAEANAAANGFSSRTGFVLLDVTARGADRAAAGLRPDHFDCVLANPPFFASGTKAPEPGRAGARHMPEARLQAWITTAIASVAPRGEVVFIHLAERLPALLRGFEGRLGAITILPLLARAGAPASRVLIRGIKGSRAPLTLAAGRPLHEPNGHRFSAEFEAILRGRERLVW